MPSNKKIKTKKPINAYLFIAIVILAVITVVFTGYVGYRISLSSRSFFPLALLALVAGLLFESFRISDNWRKVIYQFIVVFFCSLICFLPGKTERNYSFEDHIEYFPYYFLVFFAISSIIIHNDKITVKLTEGITLLLSISFVYWLIDVEFFRDGNWFIYTFMAMAGIFTIFSIINALTVLRLSRVNRLWLSIWSTIVATTMSIDNIYNVYKYGSVQTSEYMTDNLLLGLQYFFLGTCTIYIVQNYLLLSSFIPRGGGNYRSDIKEIAGLHINRYSDSQIDFVSSLICILYSCGLYYLNYKYSILPRNTMIWLVIFSFPIFLRLFEILSYKPRKNRN